MRVAIVCVVCASILLLASPLRAETPVVAAASDLQFAMGELAEAYAAEGGGGLRLVMGASGNLARQIRQGAPFELFLSADEAFVLGLSRDGLLRDEGVLYAVGRLALVIPDGSPLAPDPSLADLREALGDGRIRRFAIANPEHAPYGARAAELLRHHGLWDAILPRLVYGENVAQAAQFAFSGNAQGGIVAHSLVLGPAVAGRARHVVLPDDGHSPLRQRMALTRRAGAGAERFYEWLQTPSARAVLARHGFELPDVPDVSGGAGGAVPAGRPAGGLE